jgi:hypothetical protein
LSVFPPQITFEPISRFLLNYAPINRDNEILYGHRSSKDEQLLVRLFLSDSKNMNVESS